MTGSASQFKQKQQKLKQIKKGLWSPEEDEKLFAYIIRFGVASWTSVPHLAGVQRCGKSCRLRWLNYLRPGLKRGRFSQQEQDIILNLHRLLGNRWARIATKLPGRTDNEIKNFWNSCLKKQLIKHGIDPNTHEPILVPNECNRNKTSFASPSSLAMATELQEAFHMNSSSGLMTSADNFMKNNLFLDESKMGITPIGFDCKLLPQYQQINCETASRTIMDALIKEESRESSGCTTYANMFNPSAEILMNTTITTTTTTKYEEWNANEWQELQEVQASNAGDLDTYLRGLLSENLLGEYNSAFL